MFAFLHTAFVSFGSDDTTFETVKPSGSRGRWALNTNTITLPSPAFALVLIATLKHVHLPVWYAPHFQRRRI